MNKKTGCLIGGAATVLLLTGCCVWSAMFTSEERERSQEQITSARAACAAPRVFRLRPGGFDENAADWECVSQDVVDAEATARLAPTPAQMATAPNAEPLGNTVTELPVPPVEQDDNDSAPVPAAAPEPAEQLTFLGDIRARCAAYDDAPNEIQKSRIFREHEAAMARLQVSQIEGQLRGLDTSRGGEGLGLTILVDGSYGFRNGALAPIRRGNRVYAAAEEMTEGQCVVFSARRFAAPAGMFRSERGQVCDEDFVVEFTALSNCD